MPIPILVVAVVAGAGALGTRLALRRLRKPLKVMVLGQRYAGKTRLVNSWRGDWAPTQPTQPPGEKITKIQLKTGEKVLNVEKRFIFRTFTDVDGADEGMQQFRQEVVAATAVLYLVDARILLREEHRSPHETQGDKWVRVMEDGHRLNRHAKRAQRIVFVVTHTDLDPRNNGAPEKYHDRLAAQLAGVRNSIAAPERVRIVSGSLADPQRAELLTDDIIRNLL